MVGEFAGKMNKRPKRIAVVTSPGVTGQRTEGLEHSLLTAGFDVTMFQDETFDRSRFDVVLFANRYGYIMEHSGDLVEAQVVRDLAERTLAAGMAPESRSLAVRLARLEVHARRFEKELAESRSEADALRKKETRLRARLDTLEGSLSWRLTRPLRALKRGMHRNEKFLLLEKLRELPRTAPVYLAGMIMRRPRIKRLLGVLLHRIPSVHARLTGVARKATTGFREASAARDPVEAALTADARRVFRGLLEAERTKGRPS